MTNEKLLGYLLDYSKKTLVLSREPVIINNVHIIHVESYPPYDDYRFFVVMHEDNGVAIVLDMINDLHWMVRKRFRRRGFLSKALKETIFPYLKEEGRQVQDASATSERAADYLLKRGFSPVGTTDTYFKNFQISL